MKVKQIDSYTGIDKAKRWRVYFEGDNKPLIVGTEPAFKIGDDIPQEKLRLTSKGERQYYVWQRDNAPRKFRAEETPEKTRSMVLSYAKDLAVADKIKVEQILDEAEKFFKWVKQ